MKNFTPLELVLNGIIVAVAGYVIITCGIYFVKYLLK